MIKAVIIKDHYTLDGVYQWDRNHMLEVYGLSVEGVPELHFAHGAREKAIVQPTSIDAAGVIRAMIPNDMLEQARPINVYVCTQTGDAFQSLFKIVIPVKSRPRPADITEEVEAIAQSNRN